jgi:hypothetical protein
MQSKPLVVRHPERGDRNPQFSTVSLWKPVLVRLGHKNVDRGPKALLARGLTAWKSALLITEGKTILRSHHPGCFSGHREETCRESLCQAGRSDPHLGSGDVLFQSFWRTPHQVPGRASASICPEETNRGTMFSH